MAHCHQNAFKLCTSSDLLFDDSCSYFTEDSKSPYPYCTYAPVACQLRVVDGGLDAGDVTGATILLLYVWNSDVTFLFDQ